MKYKQKHKTNKSFLEAYEREAKNYDKNRSVDSVGKIVDTIQLEFISKLICKQNANIIMEAGCGTGRIIIPLAKNTYLNCYGSDPSKNMLFQLKKKSDKVQTKVCSIEKLKYKDNIFDLVYTMHVLMHLPKYKKAVEEMYRTTKPGGIIVCDFPNATSIWNIIAVFLNPNKPRTNLYTVKQLKESFKKYNFTITGLFSYPRTLYKWKITRDITQFLEKFIPLGLLFQTQTFVIIKKGDKKLKY